MFKLSTDEFMMERMADSYSMMDGEEKENWSMEAADKGITSGKIAGSGKEN